MTLEADSLHAAGYVLGKGGVVAGYAIVLNERGVGEHFRLGWCRGGDGGC